MLKRIALLSVVVLMATNTPASTEPHEAVNAVIGDRSALGQGSLSEQERLVVHLKYVEQVLRARSTTHLSRAQIAARLRVLSRLHAYRLNAEFPHNSYVRKRAPVFVDERGVRCAVAAIAEPDIGREEVERIARTSRLAYLPDIKSPKLLRWARDSGFSLVELAMIQPSYDDGGSVDVPEDPWPVQRAQSRLRTAWQNCRAEAYPANIGWGSSRIRNTVTFRNGKKKGELEASLVLDIVRAAVGTKRNPVPSDKTAKRFISCVQNRFKGGSYRREDGVGPKTRYGLSPPTYGGPVVREDTGKLSVGPATDHILHRVKTLRTLCHIPRGAVWRVKVKVKPNGKVESVTAKPFRPTRVENEAPKYTKPDPIGDCISSRLGKIVRFPVSEHTIVLDAAGP